MSDKSGKDVQSIIAWVCTVVTIGYFLPWAIAASRGKSNAGAVGVLNLLLGWTLIGWIVALVMACGAHQVAAVAPTMTSTVVIAQHFGSPAIPPPSFAPPAVSPPAPPAGWYAVETGGQRYWDGTSWTANTAP